MKRKIDDIIIFYQSPNKKNTYMINELRVDEGNGEQRGARDDSDFL